MRLLDLFCCEGGAGEGYRRAGFDVTGVDIIPQPLNPHRFIQADALAYVAEHGHEYDAVHASPPCQAHSSLTGWGMSRRVNEMPVDMIPQTRAALIKLGLPYVIENVEGAPLLNAFRICGQSLGLRVRRHRYFEASFPVMVPPCHHPGPPVIVVSGSIGRKVFDPRRKAIAPSLELAREVMEMPWASKNGVCQAIPPAYTEHIGGYLVGELEAPDVAA